MHFGKVPENEVSSIDFSLRPDPPGNALVLPGQPVPVSAGAGLVLASGRTLWQIGARCERLVAHRLP